MLNTVITKISFLLQSRSELSSPSPEMGKLKRRPVKGSGEAITGSHSCLRQPSRGLAELTSNSCATPPSTRRRIFLPKNLRNPFSIKRHIATVHDNSTLSGECHLFVSMAYILWNKNQLRTTCNFFNIMKDHTQNIYILRTI